MIDLEELLAEIVAIPSPTSDPIGVERVLQAIGNRLVAFGLTGPGIVYGSDGRQPHLSMRRAAVGAGPTRPKRVMLLGHADTVHEHGSGFAGYVRDGDRARGPGVADAKGGLAVLVGVVERLAAPGSNPALDAAEWVVFVSGDEEEDGRSSRALIAEHARGADLCLDFEPARPDGSLVKGRRGVGRFRLVAHGVAAHAGQAFHDGRNAIVALAHAIAAVAALNEAGRPVTVSAGVVSGGTRFNVVPDRAEVLIDARADDAASAGWVEASLRAIADRPMIIGTRLELLGGFGTAPWASSAATEALVAHWARAAATLGVPAPGAVVSGGGSDANQVQALGVATLDGLGAIGGDYHSPREWVMVPSLVGRADLHAAALASWLGRP